VTTLTLFFDGAARGNPGPAGAGAVLLDEKGVEVERIRRPLGKRTNNEAEYLALIAGLEAALAREARRILLKGDSQLVIAQLKGGYKVKAPNLKPLHAQAKKLLERFEWWDAVHIPREENADADKCANEAIDRAT
jgi:ribonuclease HI